MEKALVAIDTLAASVAKSSVVERRKYSWKKSAFPSSKRTKKTKSSESWLAESLLTTETSIAFNSLAEALLSQPMVSRLTSCKRLAECGGLWALVKCLLISDSLLDIGQRPTAYCALLDLLRAISVQPGGASLLTKRSADQPNSVFDMLQSLAGQSEAFLSLRGDENSKDTLTPAEEMAIKFVETCRDIKRRCRATAENDTAIPKASAGQYISALRPLRFEAIPLCEMVCDGTTQHVLLRYGGSSAAALARTSGHSGVVGDARRRLVRVATEMSGLASSLPVESGSAVFVRCDEARMDVLKALVVGPEDTPYALGVFEFDILLPPAYPAVPPQVRLVTTGGGTVRFNPNLYACGYVCLSLLGTWSGPGWEPERSTLLQVLVSIQALILVSDPFFNEPGLENFRFLLKRASIRYNTNIRLQTLRYAVLGAMQQPSPVFREVVAQHFYHKREALERQLAEWGSRGGKDIAPVVDETRAALAKLVSEYETVHGIVREEVGETAPEAAVAEKTARKWWQWWK